MTDKQRLNWLGRYQSQIDKSVKGAYSIWVYNRPNEAIWGHGRTLREAIDGAAKELRMTRIKAQ